MTEEKHGIYLEWAWDVATALGFLVWVANGGPWQSKMQEDTDTRSIVTERARRAIEKALWEKDVQP